MTGAAETTFLHQGAPQSAPFSTNARYEAAEMKGRDKWTPLHWRQGCWVEAYTRSNGVRVRGHWRNGGRVKAHYSSTPLFTMPRRWPRAKRHRNTPSLATSVSNTLNNAAVALVLRNAGWSTRSRSGPTAAAARLTAVTWRLDKQVFHAGCAGSDVSLPALADQITLHIVIDGSDETPITYRIDTTLFLNADGTVTTTPDSNHDMEKVARMVDRLSPAEPKSAEAVRRRNAIRQSLGGRRPERAIALALTDALTAAPLPQVQAQREVTVPDPTGRYLIVAKPISPETTSERPAARTEAEPAQPLPLPYSTIADERSAQ